MLQLAEEIAMNHHEKWDGTGYYGVHGEAIPLAARIVTVADVFDVLTHSRPYKMAWPVEQALAEIEDQTGRLFDPRLAELFLRGEWKLDLLRLAEAIDKAEKQPPRRGVPPLRTSRWARETRVTESVDRLHECVAELVTAPYHLPDVVDRRRHHDLRAVG